MKTEILKETTPISIINGYSKKHIEFSTLILTDGKVRKKDKPITDRVRGYYGIYNVESIIKQNTYYRDYTYLVKVIVKGNGRTFKVDDIIKTYKYIHTAEDKKAMQNIKIILDELNSKSSINHNNKVKIKRPSHN
jgi:hypothetical protein